MKVAPNKSEFKVLLAILESAHRDERITLRSISDRLGWNSMSYTQRCVRKLRAKGLITYEDGLDATIRLLYRLETWE